MVTAEDITARKHMEDALRERERFSSAFEFAAIGMTLVSTTGAFLKVNQALCNLLGYSAEELMALTFQAITHPDDLAADLAYPYLMRGHHQTPIRWKSATLFWQTRQLNLNC